MTPLHAVSIPAPPLAPARDESPRRGGPSPALVRRGGPSLTSALLVALLLLALLLQASFLVGLATGSVGGPDAAVAAGR